MSDWSLPFFAPLTIVPSNHHLINKYLMKHDKIYCVLQALVLNGLLTLIHLMHNFYEAGIIFVPTLQWKILKYRECKWCAQGHMRGLQRGLDVNPSDGLRWPSSDTLSCPLGRRSAMEEPTGIVSSLSVQSMKSFSFHVSKLDSRENFMETSQGLY